MKKSPSDWIRENLPWIERVIALALVAATIILLAAAARGGFWPTPETAPYSYLSDRLRIVAIVFVVLFAAIRAVWRRFATTKRHDTAAGDGSVGGRRDGGADKISADE